MAQTPALVDVQPALPFVAVGLSDIEGVVKFDLLRQRELAPAAGITVQADTAAVIRAPLTERAIGTGMFFRSLFIHE